MSAAIKVKRFQANESEFTKTGRNRTEVKVPASVGFSDLTGSRVILDSHVTVQQGSTIVPLPVTFGNYEMVGGPQALIRNSRVVSAQNGLLNERRYANVIDANLDWYSKSRAQEDVHATFGWSNTNSYGADHASGLPDCPYIVYNRPSLAQPSTITNAYTRRAEVPVAWKHIDNFGNISQFPHVNVGDLTYHMEFEDQIDVAFPAPMPSRAPVPCVNTAAVGGVLKTLSFVPTNGALYRPPQVGDLCTAFFVDTSGTDACYAPRAIATGMGGFTAGAAAMDQITDVSLTSAAAAGVYTVTLLNGFAVAGATDTCEKILLSYFSPSELDGNTANKIPLPLGVNIYQSSDVVGGTGGAPITFAPNSLGGIEATLNDAGTLTVTADAFKSIPWYPGAPVTLTGLDANANAPVRLETFVTQVDVDVVGGTYNVKVYLQDTITLAAATGTYSLGVPCLTFRDSKMTGDVFTGTAVKFTCNWTIDEVYLELLQLQLTPSMMDKAMKQMANIEIPFYDQLLIQKNMPATTLHTEVLSLPANTVGISVLTPQNLSLVSGFDNCARYRVALNGKELTNQDINVGPANRVGRQIHNVLLREHLLNIGRQLKKFDAPKFCYDINADKATHAMYGVVVPQVPIETIFQLQLFADNNMAAKNIYFLMHIERVLKLGGAGRAQVL